MNELELLVNDTKCSIEDAVNYLDARTMFYRAVVDEQDKLKRYFEEYTKASNRLYGARIIKINEDGIYINNIPIRTEKQ
jgi:hypothetical protein